MKIAKALKTLSRLKGEAHDLSREIQECVSTIQGNEFDFSYAEKMAEYKVCTSKIANLKAAIMKANVNNSLHGSSISVFESICLLAELKNELKLITSLDIKEGIEHNPYSNSEVSYNSQISNKEKSVLSKKVKKNIEDIIDELDAFNSITEI